MTIDPRISFWLGVIATICVFSSTGAGAESLSSMFSAAAAVKISAAFAYVGGILTLVVTALHAIPSQNGPAAAKLFYLGPPAPVVPDAAKKAVTLFLAASLALALSASQSIAQQRKEPAAVAPPTRGDIFHPIINPKERSETDITTLLTNLADISGAIALSTQIPALQDPVGNACWQQFSGIGELLKAHPEPLTLKVASDWEALRLLAIGLNQVCANPNCGQMFVDATNAASAISGNPLNISLQSICSKVPVIGTNAVPTSATHAAPIGTSPTPVVPPVPPTPTPTPTPSK